VGKLGEQHQLIGLIELKVILEALIYWLVDLPGTKLIRELVLSKGLYILLEIRLEVLMMRVWVVLASHV
jgi:hypothetical protein